MSDIVILVEEDSMKVFLKAIEPALRHLLGLRGRKMVCISPRGKGNLKTRCARFIRNQRMLRPRCQFMIVCDQDHDDCRKLKNLLLEIAKQCGVAKLSCVRVVCRELEAWLLGDIAALKAAFPGADTRRIARFVPDSISDPKKIVSHLAHPRTAKQIAWRVGSNMSAASIGENRSASFQHFVSGLGRLCKRRN